MNNRTLGIIALLGAPFLFLGMLLEMQYPTLKHSWFTGLWGILYITPWMGSVVALQRLKATGKSRFGRIILWTILASLFLADVSNVMLVLWSKDLPSYYFYIDLFWPFSNVLMLVVGITVVVAKQLSGWRRFVPLIVGCWLPFAFMMLGLLGRTTFAFVIGGLYSAIAWTLLAIMVLTIKNENSLIYSRKQEYRLA